MRLSTENHETTHFFHVVGDGIRITYDGILGEDFFISKKARINYNKREIVMGGVKLKFDDKILSDERVKEMNRVSLLFHRAFHIYLLICTNECTIF